VNVAAPGPSPRRTATPILFFALLLLPTRLFSASAAQTQPAVAASPDTSLSAALSAACRQDQEAFANFLTSDNAAAYRKLAAAH